MPTYIGQIEFKNNFVNFKPTYKFENGEKSYLTIYERKDILPNSENGNINLYSKNSSQKANDIFYNDEIIAIDFDDPEKDLEANYNTFTGERNQTGYKLEISQAMRNNRIHYMHELGFYYLMHINDLIGNYKKNNILELNENNDNYPYGELQVVVQLNDLHNTVIGPYTVQWSEKNNNYIINTDVVKRNYVLNGYLFNKYIAEFVDDFGKENEELYFIRLDPKFCADKAVDVLPREQLLASFSQALKSDTFKDGKLDLSDIDKAFDEYNSSPFLGDNIPNDIKNSRREALKNIFENEKDVSNTFNYIFDCIGKVLERNQNKKPYEDLIQRLLEKDEVISGVQRFQIVTARIDEAQKKLDELNAKIQEKEDELSNLESRHENNIQNEYADSLADSSRDVIEVLQQQIASLEEKKKQITEEIHFAEECLALQEKLERLNEDVKYKEKRVIELDNSISAIEGKIDQIFSNSTSKAMDFAFDGMLANRMMKQAADWEEAKVAVNYKSVIDKSTNIVTSSKTGDELVGYLVDRISSVRESYDWNTIVNILICYTQGFLTVFSGEPGTGKTSICKILGTTLGIDKLDDGKGDVCLNRFLPVAVERGWTTKRDFVGYYNPLTKTFDKNNREVYDALNILNTEAQNNQALLPYIVLLDEANLSPMEYYWADFMSVCDDNNNSTINLGDNYIFKIPDNLRFVATINNDHTTDTLSPRLIDRAWIIRLPLVKPSQVSYNDYKKEDFEPVTWKAMVETFGASGNTSGGAAEKDTFITSIFEELVKKFKELNVTTSPRIKTAIWNYHTAAVKLFKNDQETQTDPTVIALDYAISQRLLPHIEGNGEFYRGKLESLKEYCNLKHLYISESIIADIIQRGDETMQYYQFFS